MVRVHCHHGSGVPSVHHSHPVVVLAFKAVYTLETKRHENNEKVLALYAQYVASNFDRAPHLTNFRMKDMVAVLLQCVLHFRLAVCFPDRRNSRLEGVSDPKKIGPDGQTIEGRMQTLCEAAAEDIKNCGSACDAYTK